MSFADWYHQLPLHIDPVFFTLPGLEFGVRWYSMGYIFAFLTAFIMMRHRIKNEIRFNHFDPKMIEDVFFWLIISLVAGARIGYIFIYDFTGFIEDPIATLLPFNTRGGFHVTGISGMSYHGGVIGFLIASLIITRKKKIGFLNMIDFFAPLVPLGYTFGRLGNFMNGELYGRSTDHWAGMFFIDPRTGQAFDYMRHPSQLYEAFLEGIVVFFLIWFIRKQQFTRGIMGGLYLIGYGCARFIVEFVRQPDTQMGSNGFYLGIFSMGQFLCLTMILAGLSWIALVKKRNPA